MNLTDKVQYTLKKSHKRKTIAIRVMPYGEVEVLAPFWCSRIEIDKIVRERIEWILKTQRRYKTYPKAAQHTYMNRDSFYLYGKRKKLELAVDSTFSISVFDDVLKLTMTPRMYDGAAGSRRTYCRKKIIQWYKNKAELMITERVSHWCSIYPELAAEHISTDQLTIRHMKRRWGSCDKAGRLTFNCTTICAPRELIDYVIIHELCHRKEFNHGRVFYQMMDKYIPNHKDLQEEMRRCTGLWVL